jgi:hypothetical protein
MLNTKLNANKFYFNDLLVLTTSTKRRHPIVSGKISSLYCDLPEANRCVAHRQTQSSVSRCYVPDGHRKNSTTVIQCFLARIPRFIHFSTQMSHCLDLNRSVKELCRGEGISPGPGKCSREQRGIGPMEPVMGDDLHTRHIDSCCAGVQVQAQVVATKSPSSHSLRVSCLGY